MGYTLVLLAAVVVVVILGIVILSWRRPQLGPVDGRLRDCPDSPNCVSSTATDESHRVEPFPGHGDTFDGLRSVLAGMPGVTIIRDDGDYLRAECTTRVLRFVDDLEFLSRPDEGLIHVRSASRVGRSDFGANRNRVEEIRRRLNASVSDGSQ